MTQYGVNASKEETMDCQDCRYQKRGMTEYCLSCLGCQQMEQEDFHGVHKCPQYVDGREPEGQIEMEESQ